MRGASRFDEMVGKSGNLLFKIYDEKLSLGVVLAGIFIKSYAGGAQIIYGAVYAGDTHAYVTMHARPGRFHDLKRAVNEDRCRGFFSTAQSKIGGQVVNSLPA